MEFTTTFNGSIVPSGGERADHAGPGREKKSHTKAVSIDGVTVLWRRSKFIYAWLREVHDVRLPTWHAHTGPRRTSPRWTSGYSVSLEG
jgi:hypothetical protein